MGKPDFPSITMQQACEEAIKDSLAQGEKEVMHIKTAGGRYEVQWNHQGKATAMG